MQVAIVKEISDNEIRVAATPETVKKFVAAGFSVAVQSGAGEASAVSDSDYKTAGASVESDARSILGQSDIVLKVEKPVKNTAAGAHEADLIKEGALLICFLQPLTNHELVQKLARRNITAFSMDAVPRIARAQKLDALSSQANVSGYKAVLVAANLLGKMLPMMITAAGTILPAKVFVIGAGVAGLQAIATAKRLGAVVEAFDTRPVVKEQVESLGAKFVQLEIKQETEDKSGYAKELSKEDHSRELEFIATHAKVADIVITTAQIPGKRAPQLITEETVKNMRRGSVIVDLAAEGGGNCTLTEPGKAVLKHGVTIVGTRNFPALMPAQSSQLYARNIAGLFFEIVKDGKINLDLTNEVIKGSLITHGGKIVHEGVAGVINHARTLV
ncbi:MAG: Re/Si-specific NAD(P)(+) transhydrogenase subunit alpha [Candidatus Omnitrophica bacterium]|nr:Re/Si-specific NAD(P)(+) transhydrogenase subunit alpha [Candidatus Omnitrophota bacterium]